MALLLASSSPARAELLARAGIAFQQRPARVDEEALRAALEAEEVSPRDMADALAEAKARRLSGKEPQALVLGADQVLDFAGRAHGKFPDQAAALAGLMAMQGQRHMLHSAAVLYEGGAPIWRHVSTVRLHMRPLSEAYLKAYLDAHWQDVSYCTGAYRLEAEGVRLFQRIDGDFFAVLGLPILEIQSYLAMRGDIAT